MAKEFDSEALKHLTILWLTGELGAVGESINLLQFCLDDSSHDQPQYNVCLPQLRVCSAAAQYFQDSTV